MIKTVEQTSCWKPKNMQSDAKELRKSNTLEFLNPWCIICVELMFFFQARVAAAGLKATAASQHGAPRALKAFTAPALQRACFSTSM